MIDSYSKRIGSFFFIGKDKSKKLRKIHQAGFKEPPKKNLGRILIALYTGSLLYYLYLIIFLDLFLQWGGMRFIMYPIIFVIAIAIITLLCNLIFWISVMFIIYRRTNISQKHLPDFLRELSTNLRAGREFVDALEASTDKDMGVLHEDISHMVISIRSGKRVSSCIQEYANKYDSYIINEIMELILDAYNGGGGMANMLDRISDNLDTMSYLKKEAVANVSNYIIFMTIVALVIAPLLFALSYNMLWLIESLLSRITITGTVDMLPTFVQNIRIDFADFVIFSRIGVWIIAASAATIIATTMHGTMRSAPVTIVYFSIISLACFEISLWLLGWFFEVMFTI